jgi:hypothetical protein
MKAMSIMRPRLSSAGEISMLNSRQQQPEQEIMSSFMAFAERETRTFLTFPITVIYPVAFASMIVTWKARAVRPMVKHAVWLGGPRRR